MKQRLIFLGLACLAHSGVQAQVQGIKDSLSGATSTFPWTSFGGACLTAGNGSVSTIPACGNKDYLNRTHYGGVTGLLPDPIGQGALRLTNNGNQHTGGVVSDFTVPTNAGLEITFSTVTYGGDGAGNPAQGADGMSFFVSDGSVPASIGARGGSLGYTCSNLSATTVVKTTPDGVIGGYFGIGIDEYGNFANEADTTNTGIGFAGNRVSIRGGGSTAFAELNRLYPTYYPSSFTVDERYFAIQKTCAGGKVYDFRTKNFTTPTAIADLPRNYKFLDSRAFVGSGSITTIANQQKSSSPRRALATELTYRVKISQSGILDMGYSVNGGAQQAVATQRDMKVDGGPMPATFRFGFGASTGGGTNIHEITCFKAGPPDLSNSSAGTNVQSAKVQAGSQAYLAFYHPNNWWGELRAHDLLVDPVTDTLSIHPVPTWDASCNLTGGACASTKQPAQPAQDPDRRRIVTWNTQTQTGVPFRWPYLTNDQRNSLRSLQALDYLRGRRDNEIQPAGVTGSFRYRTGILGDIVNSSPTWVGPSQSPYGGVWVDKLDAGATLPENNAGGQSFSAFKAQTATRPNVVYVGANDGLLHGFQAGAYDADNNFKATGGSAPNDGKEVLAYVPPSVIDTIRSAASGLDYLSETYAHNLYVDGTPGAGDLYFGNAWHTWLVGGLGAGADARGVLGQSEAAAKGAIYVLDVTDPRVFSEVRARQVVKGNWTSDNLACTGTPNCGDSLGHSFGAPLIRRLHNGNWAALFGNGLNSKNGEAGLFVMLIDQAGAVSFRHLATGAGPKRDATTGAITQRNGIVEVQSADLDKDHITDFVYAGDVFGNVWRFDLTHADPDSWSVSKRFQAAGGLPITTAISVSSNPKMGSLGEPGVMLSFGTGRQWQQSVTAAARYAPGSHRTYGIWDFDMNGWNAKSTYAQYAALPSTQVNATQTDLRIQSATDVDDIRKVTNHPVCWKGSTTCATANDHLGWTLELLKPNEQVVFNPVLIEDRWVVNTYVPVPATSLLKCDINPPPGYSMGLATGNGGEGESSFFANADGTFPTAFNITGIALNGVGAPWLASTPGKSHFLVTQTGNGQGAVRRIHLGSLATLKRLTWIKKR